MASINQLPRELIDAILHQCILLGPRNSVLNLRLVNRFFNTVLKPHALASIGLDFSRLSLTSDLPRPQPDALQTIGYHAKNMFIDTMVLRDDLEVEFLNTVFRRVRAMDEFCRNLQERYCMGESTFTEMEFYETLEGLLFNCRETQRLRLNLPFQLVGRHCNAATMILANTFKAFANRPEEDSAALKVLVLENLPDIAVVKLWMNPIDVSNIIRVFGALEHMVITLRRHEMDPQHSGAFGSCLWNMVHYAEQLQSLCFIAMDNEDPRPPRGLKQVKFFQMAADEWRARSLPSPHPQVPLGDLRCLELKRVEILPEVLIQAAQKFPKLEELYLNEVYLKAEQSPEVNPDSLAYLWVGLPNQRPPEGSVWLAMELRALLPRLRICRASFLGYDHYLRDEAARHPDFDVVDPCGLGRSVSQRFVEVITGIQQPNMPSGQPIEYLPSRNDLDTSLLTGLTKRTKPLGVVDYDTNAYQTVVGTTPARWHSQGLDGNFPNCNPITLEKLHRIAETACAGMNEVHSGRSTQLFDEMTGEDQNQGPGLGWEYNQA